jgi:vacuolar-type H+-ATPase subunit D/Vma8
MKKTLFLLVTIAVVAGITFLIWKSSKTLNSVGEAGAAIFQSQTEPLSTEDELNTLMNQMQQRSKTVNALKEEVLP